MKAVREALILVALSLVAGAGVHFFHPRAPAWHEVEEPLRDDEVTLKSISEKWKGDVLWIDARPRDQYQQGHLPGAININEQELESQLIDNFPLLQDNRKPVVIYCDSGGCQASRKIKEYLTPRMPSLEFYVLKGGWKNSPQSPAKR